MDPPALGQGIVERPQDGMKICRAAAAYVEQFFLIRKRVHCAEKGVDSLNRSGEGLGPSDVHVLASFVVGAGCDPLDRLYR